MSSYTDKTYIVFLDLPVEIQTKIDSVRMRYSVGGHKKWHSHITFKQDEDFLLVEVDLIQQALDYFKNIQQIKLTLDGPKIQYMDNDNWNIYIGISDTDYLKQSIKDFSLLIEKYIDPQSPRAFGSTKWEQSDNFYPHISLKGGSGKELGEKIFNEMSREDFTIDFPTTINCGSVTLAKWNLDKWQELKKIQLVADNM